MYAGLEPSPTATPNELDEPDTTERAERPAWVTGAPTMDGYFVGVGGSETGVLSEDRRVAEMRARRDLAASISVEIESEVRARSFESSLDDERFTEIAENLAEGVEADISGIELADTYEDPEHGYWALVRLSKERWTERQEREQSRLRARVTGLLERADTELSVAQEMTSLSNAWNVLAESPHGVTVEGEFRGNSGFFVDLIFERYAQVLEELRITLEPIETSVPFDEPLTVRGNVDSKRPTGALPLLIEPEAGADIAADARGAAGAHDDAGEGSVEAKEDAHRDRHPDF